MNIIPAMEVPVLTHKLFALCVPCLLAIAPADAAVPKKERPRVIVAPFPVAKGAYEGWGGWGYGYVGGETRISDVLQDLCVTTLIEEGSEKVRVMDRARLNEVLAEQKLNASGLVDESDDPANQRNLAKMGKLLGVRWMVTGKVTRFAYKKSGFASGWGVGEAVGRLTKSGLAGGVAGSVHVSKATLTGRLDMKLIDVQTAEIVAVAHDEATMKDMGVKVAGTGNEIVFDQEMINKIFEPIIEKLSKQMLKKITVAHAEADND
jgi:curli biogenesis system outer membrane secretion channel CsgG